MMKGNEDKCFKCKKRVISGIHVVSHVRRLGTGDAEESLMR